MRHALVTLIPSVVDEAFPLTGMESLACGTPIVGFDSGGIAELACDGAGVVVARGDIRAAAAEVINICKDPVTWSDHSKQCVHVSKNFSPANFRNSMKALLQHVLRKNAMVTQSE
jgi:glycosyltransferase involved in cell wall biosynthesis